MTAVRELIERVEALDAKATKGPWFNVGRPWNEWAAYVNAGSEDPHQGRLVCDLSCQRDEETGEYDTDANDIADGDIIAESRTLLPTMAAALKVAVKALEARSHHMECEDSWYSCPQSKEGCSDPNAVGGCTCGAGHAIEAIAEIGRIAGGGR